MNEKMTVLIKSQIGYIRFYLFHTFIIAIGIFTYAYARDFNPINLFTFLLFVQYSSLVVLKQDKENRYYLIRLLTLTAKEAARSRIILIVIGFIFIYLIAALFNLFLFSQSGNFRNGFQELFMFGGIALLGIFIYLTLSDTFTIFRSSNRYIWFNIITAIIVAVIAFFLIIIVLETYQSSTLISSQIITTIYLVSFGLAMLSIFTYQKRESYLGYK